MAAALTIVRISGLWFNVGNVTNSLERNILSARVSFQRDKKDNGQ